MIRLTQKINDLSLKQNEAVLRYVVKPTEDELERMKSFLMKEFQAENVTITLEEAPQLIGGFILRYGNQEFDFSIKERLKNIRDELEEKNRTRLQKQKK